jgi:hypothetical protein
LADEAIAEYRDRRMYSRIVDGMMKKKNQYRSTPTTTSDSTIDTIRHIMETRHQLVAQKEQQEFAPRLRKRIGYFSDKSPVSEKENRTTSAGSTTTSRSTTTTGRPRCLNVSGSSWQDWPSSPPPQEGSSSSTTSTTTSSPQPQAVDDLGLGVSSLYYCYDNAASQRTTAYHGMVPSSGGTIMLVRDEPKKMATTTTTS